MPVCSQGNIFDIALKVDLTVVFGHIAFNDLGGTWLEFKRNYPRWGHIHDPFLEFHNKPQAICEGHWIWFVPDEHNGGMSFNLLAETLECIFEWASKANLHTIATNGVADIDHEHEHEHEHERISPANQTSIHRRVRVLNELIDFHETSKGLEVKLISLSDVFIRN